MVIREAGATFGVKRTAGVNSMIAGLNVTVPILDRNRGEVDRATAERVVAERELAWNERLIAAEVAGAYEVAQRTSARVADLQRTFLSRAEESSRIALATYQEGAATLLQVLDATRTLAAARLSYSRAVFAAREGLFELDDRWWVRSANTHAPLEVNDDVPAVDSMRRSRCCRSAW